jgi:hypothetical protein
LKLLNTHFKSVENITDDRFMPYITVFKQNVCLITFDKFLTNVKLFNVYIKVHNTTSDIGHKPVIGVVSLGLKPSGEQPPSG